jgi:hypothetical protein
VDRTEEPVGGETTESDTTEAFRGGGGTSSSH